MSQLTWILREIKGLQVIQSEVLPCNYIYIVEVEIINLYLQPPLRPFLCTLGTFLEKKREDEEIIVFECFFFFQQCAFRDLKTSKPSPSTPKAFYDRLRCNCWILADFESVFFPLKARLFLLVWIFDNSLLGLKGGRALLMVQRFVTKERRWSLMLK